MAVNQKPVAGSVGDWRVWPPVAVAKPRAVHPDPVSPEKSAGPSPAELQRIREQAYREAYATGLEAGRAAGVAQLSVRARELEALFGGLADPFATAGEALQAQLAALITALVRQLVRRELRAEPSVIVAVVREAIGLLPVSQQRPRVHLHPEDAALLRELLHLDGEDKVWSLVEDPTVSRGGCRVRTDDSTIDATLESRVARLCAATLGSERAEDANP